MTYRHYALVATLFSLAASPALAQEIRTYDVNFTSNNIVADGTISPGEWDGSAGDAGDWRELREPFEDVDSDNNRFRILYDANNLYILHQSDYVGGPDGDMLLDDFGGNPDISFGEENLNLYIDPNRDGDLNTDSDGNPLAPGADNGSNTDGYQFAFNQYEGLSISTPADRQGTGFFTEAHVNSPFGDQANWNGGADAASGPGFQGGMIVAQNNTNTPAAGEPSIITEIIIPFADLNADELIPGPAPNADYNGDGEQDAADYTVWRDTLGDSVGTAGDGILDGADGDDNGIVDQADYDLWVEGFGRSTTALTVETGLNATDGGTRTGPEAGEMWGFNMSVITRDGDDGENFLPIWNHRSGGSFAPWPHGVLTFQGVPSGSGVPEPGSVLLLLTCLSSALIGRRRR